jgi:pimeloyl-ACP methyl ester carboxylesterase
MNLIEEAARHRLLERPELPIRCPVRLIHGMADADVPWRTSLRVMEQLASPDARLILVKDGEHTLSREQDLLLLTRTLGELLV